jgi:hypothetical protein
MWILNNLRKSLVLLPLFLASMPPIYGGRKGVEFIDGRRRTLRGFLPPLFLLASLQPSLFFLAAKDCWLMVVLPR